MKVVGLISGGKDSVWNLHYCKEFGHEVLCLAHLKPPSGQIELDSYMYQSVGSDLCDQIAEALELPLLCRRISGRPKGVDCAYYVPQEGDEVEDLSLLLQTVMEQFPVEAVSCGAILSDYQRVRVENVCGRLGLKVLAFLWRQEQPHLLQQMIRGGVDARLAKVACMGLDSRHVGKSILDCAISQHLLDLGRKWGVHVCGEGGEYETVVFDAPLFKATIEVPQTSLQVIPHPGGDADGVALLTVQSQPLVVTKDAGRELPPYRVLEAYNSLSYYNETFEFLRKDKRHDPASQRPSRCRCKADSSDRRPSLACLGHALWVTSSLDASSFKLAGATPAAQCSLLLDAISSWLKESGRDLQEAVFAEVYVADLQCFESLNSAYSGFFTSQPPARVCIQTELPPGIHLRVRLTLADRACTSKNLRVQSISTWAMACIGPYSQARCAAGLLFSSGVIGLVPHSMALPDAVGEAVRSLLEEDGSLHQWEVELWLLMRSLHNVLQVLGNGFANTRLVTVYTSGGCELAEVQNLVLKYIHRHAPNATPLMATLAVPQLPKGGVVEVSLVCDDSDVASPPSSHFILVESTLEEPTASALLRSAESLVSSLQAGLSPMMVPAGEPLQIGMHVHYATDAFSEQEIQDAVHFALIATFPAGVFCISMLRAEGLYSSVVAEADLRCIAHMITAA